MVGESMEFGPLIKYYRTQKDMTQKQLAEGICSVPHLSKIENNSKEANEETIQLLLDRLQIDMKEISEKEAHIRILLKALLEKIQYYLQREAEEIFIQLKEMDGIIPFSAYIYTYELYKYRYLLFTGKLDEAGEKKNLLNKQKKNFSQHERYLFDYYNAIWLIMKGDYKRADEAMDKLDLNPNHEFSSGEVLYHRALIKSALDQAGYAVHFGKMALQSYMDQHNFKRILHTLMLLGINYTHSEIYEEAMACFEHLKRNAEFMQETELLPLVYHNIGFLHQKKRNEAEALEFYDKSLSLQTGITFHYLVTLYSIGEIHFANNNFETAKECFCKLSSLSKEFGVKKYFLLAEFHLVYLEAPEKSISFLEDKVIPFLEDSNGNKEDIMRFYKLLSEHYKQLGVYQKAVKYLNKIS
ncbi:helix-turn-helix domain-containing protein [Neobacillus sp. PS3-34]|uniref:tetratricopeptide repeat protein n=1 Tax=Neobacillus sp. PS3-34 TaxID=3070678 RepID=UPI0027E2003E|nr:tetratricopeptide repeat protein [Neobacillus sp. PS3-34]WML47126.1 helix-turn-helix domain-containing protein [Neobacillus sp. PS3-34]